MFSRRMPSASRAASWPGTDRRGLWAPSSRAAGARPARGERARTRGRAWSRTTSPTAPQPHSRDAERLPYRLEVLRVLPRREEDPVRADRLRAGADTGFLL